MEATTNAVTRRKSNVGRRILTIIILVLLFALSFYVWWQYYFTYSDGFRYGLLQKFSRRGSVFKTYEGEMILSSVRSNANIALASEKFYFSVTNKSVAQKMEALQGHAVTVHYKQKNGAAFWRGDSEYIVDSVKQE